MLDKAKAGSSETAAAIAATVDKAKLELEKTNNSLENLKASIDYDVAQSKLKIIKTFFI